MENFITYRSSKVSYGDNAVAYVQLKRNGDVCTVKAKITPEHKIHKKAYNVCAVINEREEEVVSCTCLDCPASEGMYLQVIFIVLTFAYLGFSLGILKKHLNIPSTFNSFIVKRKLFCIHNKILLK